MTLKEIIDADGNSYDQGEVRAIFMYRQLMNDFAGQPCDIRSLKQHLKTKLSRVISPTVTVDWGHTVSVYKQPR